MSHLTSPTLLRGTETSRCSSGFLPSPNETCGRKETNALRGTETPPSRCQPLRLRRVAKHLMPFGALKLIALAPRGGAGRTRVAKHLMPCGALKHFVAVAVFDGHTGSKAPNALRGTEGQSSVFSPWPGERLRDVAAWGCRCCVEFRTSTEMSLTWWSGCGMLVVSSNDRGPKAVSERRWKWGYPPPRSGIIQS
jgi:hypothetical protein